MTHASRPAHPHRFRVPTRADLADRLDALVRADTAAARAEAAEWAAEYVEYDDPQLYPAVDDPAVWDALTALAGADLATTDRPFLHGAEDFAAWREALLSAPGPRARAGAPAS